MNTDPTPQDAAPQATAGEQDAQRKPGGPADIQNGCKLAGQPHGRNVSCVPNPGHCPRQ
ncbi:hypothetical protein GCM10020229_26750 [Kitasatospora albolonga]|uniref:hypothetical protein n=1 Tax=Kitasatospora albolonga TaxID=68173 RepID=UPI0031EBB6CE